MSLTPWREIAVPHADVRKGEFLQSEFAADISAVRAGKGPAEYTDAAKFFERTYITEGMRLLLTQVAQRLAGKGGEPVIQLQTAFGGGKTHTLLAVWHLATRECPLSELTGLPSLVEQAGLMDVPKANVGVIDGTAHSPGQPWKHGRATVRTLWGELAWQLGKADGFALVKESDAAGTSPGKEVLRQLLEMAAPCVVLLDELVVYVRQFEGEKAFSGGTYDSNLSFVQALTEAAKLVPNVVVLGSLPDSRSASSGNVGARAILALEHIFGRVQAIWKPVTAEEGFEIVRRRLFEPIRDEKARDAVCRAFADAYTAEGAKLPSETHEGRYHERLRRAYPIHPELFDRLYEDWSTLETFQRTRGVLKLMAKVIARLWKDGSGDAMILPGSLPLTDGGVRNELTGLLPSGWDAVLDGDIDGDKAEATDLDNREPRFGAVQAARRVARALFLGSAPSSAAVKPGVRGLDRGRVLLGCMQPGQAAAVYADALGRLADRLHYLNSSGDKAADATRFWFDTRANLRREMEDRKRRFDEKTDVRKRIEEVVKKLFANCPLFDGVHVFAPHSDVPDDSALRLVVLPPEGWYRKDDPRPATEFAMAHLREHGNQPRHRANRLLFVAPDQAVLPRLVEAARVALAWASIVDDVAEGRLNIDQAQRKQAEKEAEASSKVVPQAARECFKWLLTPVQDDPQPSSLKLEATPLPTSSGTLPGELDRACKEGLVVTTWAPVHLRTELQRFYWTASPHLPFGRFWEDVQKYVYLPRLLSRDTLAGAVRAGATNRDFFGTAYAHSGSKYDGFAFGDGGGVTVDDSLLLIEPAAAREYAIAQKKLIEVKPPEVAGGGGQNPDPDGGTTTGVGTGTKPPVLPTTKVRSFHGSVEVDAALAKSKLNSIAVDLIALLAADPNATVRVKVEIDADFPDGASENTKRSVSANAQHLGFKLNEWE